MGRALQLNDDSACAKHAHANKQLKHVQQSKQRINSLINGLIDSLSSLISLISLYNISNHHVNLDSTIPDMCTHIKLLMSV